MNRRYEQELFLAASPERVWQALTTPAEMAKWIGSPIAAFEPRAGGRFEVQGLHAGVVEEFDPPRRLVWAWDPDNGQEPNREVLTLVPEGSGTRLSVAVETRGKWSTDPLYFGGVKAGWIQWLAALHQWVEAGRAPEQRPAGAVNAVMGVDTAGGRERLFFRTVAEGGAAAAAGIRAGDRVVAWDGRPIDEVSTFWLLVWASVPGQQVRLDLERDGVGWTADLTLGAPRTA